MMPLVRRDLDQIDPAYFKGCDLIAEASAHLDFNAVEKRPAAPAILFSTEHKSLAGLPVHDVERPCSAQVLGISFHNRVARERQFGKHLRIGLVAIYDQCVALSLDIPRWIRKSQRGGNDFTRKGRRVVELYSTAQPKLPALISPRCQPRVR